MICNHEEELHLRQRPHPNQLIFLTFIVTGEFADENFLLSDGN
jgi:hypothetical protein